LSRRVCPVCSRRYAGLIAEDCPVCAGVGSIGLGAPALASAEPAAVARAVELYLEGKARQARSQLPHVAHRAAVEAAMLELRSAGVVTSAVDYAAPAKSRRKHPEGPVADSVAEARAARMTVVLGAPLDSESVGALSPTNVMPLEEARTRLDPFPRASANGHLSVLVASCDPVDPLGPDCSTLAVQRDARDHRGEVLARATDEVAAQRARRRKKGATA
jgi:hypothetical protein